MTTTADAESATSIGATAKGLPLSASTATGWSLFDGTVAFPAAVLRDSALGRNSAAMAGFCARHGVSLAPHGKTTMAPELFRRQIHDGAWAITAATVRQAAVMRAAGVDRVLIANEVVVSAEVAWLAESIADGFEVCCYVDSIAGVAILESALAATGLGVRLPVLLEYGIVGGRTGVRSVEAGLEVAEAVCGSSHLVLAGVAGFEGIIVDGPAGSARELVDRFLDGIVELAHSTTAAGWFAAVPEVIVSAGGSAYFDRVVDRFAAIEIDKPVRIVVRSGCYLTHDDGGIAAVSPLPDEFVPAIEVWGAVLSRPEPTRAIVGIGKRDASHDGQLPVGLRVRRRLADAVEAIAPLPVVSLNDQHAYLDLDPSDPLAVGDLVGFGISHPCTTFDKWRTMLLVDDDYVVIGHVATEF